MGAAGATPGPWQQNPANPEEIVADGECQIVARVPSAATGLYNRHAPANARLIAAAPDLLAACEELLAPLQEASAALQGKGFVPDEYADAAFGRARAAIARARGEA